jgi:murein DD-endopeptidase MepM/ murein hydrolase activator NlpD
MRNWKTVLLIPILCLFFISCSKKNEQKPTIKPNAYRLEVDSLIEVHGTIEKNQTLSDILLPHGVPSQTINGIEQRAKNIFPVNGLKAGNDFYIYAKWDTVETLKYFVYVQNEVEYVVFDLRDSINIYLDKRDVKLNERIVSGVIKNSLWETFESLNIEPEVAVKLADIYACQIDFFKIQQSDSFKVVYEEQLVENKPVGAGKILAANFYHAKENFYAFRFDKNNEINYYDEKGNSLKRAFLKAPLKFSRISSRYSLKRFHPVLGRNKAHLGTDYAAPTGTPIMSVGDGTVLEAQFKKFNGNYVKILHNKTYTTQYLHMSKIAKGMRKGVHVKQGQIIGYVGSTGLATGPHVCFRFWKNGKQVDPLREKTVSSGPVAKKDRKEFLSIKDSLMTKLISSVKKAEHSSKS